MPSINISESDFEAVAGAAMDAKDCGNMNSARKLDKIARKINAALTANSYIPSLARQFGMSSSKPMGWKDMPSTIGE